MKESYTNLIKLTFLLSDGQFHDGETLGDHLGITRAAIWKMTNKLAEYGVPVASVKGKGYALEEPLILINKQTLESALDKKLAKQLDITVLESISSTATFLRNHYNPHKTSICIAEHQGTGLGRLGRSWNSPFGLNIYFSSRFHFQCDIADLSGLSLAVSIAVAQTLEKFGAQPQIKWPNDIYCDQKKCAGTLIELIAESNGTCDAIISVGINVNMLNKTIQINQPWTSVREHTGTLYDRNQLCIEFIQRLLQTVADFREKGLPFFKALYQHYDYLYQRPVVIEQFQSTLQGKAIGVDDFGRLLLQTEAKKVVPVSAGDAHIMKKQ